MGTISEKLVYLNGTKQAIKQAINEDFEAIDNNTTFREYAEEISSNNAKYKDLIPKETKNATNTLDISNSSGLDKALVTQYGNTYQKTTTGKNLFGYGITAVDNTASYRPNQYQRLLLSATANPNEVKFNYNGTYCFGYIEMNGIDGTLPYSISFNIKENTTNYTPSVVVDTTNSTNQKLVIIINGNNKGTSTSSRNYFILTNIQVESGSTLTQYEPYTNGASPNPDYPQEIQVVTGDNTINIEGKNLFDINNQTVKYGYAKDGSGNEIESIGSNYTTSYTPVKPNTTYTFSFNLSAVVCRIYFYNSNKTWIDRTDNIINSSNKYTFTTPNNCYYLQFQNVINYTTGNIQLEKSNQATTYDPYQSQSYAVNLGSMELCKIGNYKDRIYPLNGKWYLNKQIGKEKLTSSNVVYHGVSNNIYQYEFNSIYTPLQNQSLSTHFSYKSRTQWWAYDNQIVVETTSDNVIHFYITTSDYANITQFNNFTSSNDVYVYYVLATPTTTEITESNYPTLYNQLNNIKLFEGVNHITMTNESGLDVEFDITYYKDWKLD